MKPTLSFNLLLCLASGALQAQVAFVQVSAPQTSVLSGRSLQLTARAFDANGGTMAGFAPRWRSLDESVAAVNGGGLARGLRPGVTALEASDPQSGLSARYDLRVAPLRIEITPADVALRAGETAGLSARAVDADGRTIDGVAFLWRSGVPGIAAVSPAGVVTAVQAGAATISAVIDGAGAALNYSASAEVTVYRKPEYRLTQLLSSDDKVAGSVRAVNLVSVANDSLVAFVADTSSGSQALMLAENGVARTLAVSGQLLPAANKIINRFTGVSVNTAGDVVASIAFPAEWCDGALMVFKRNQPAQMLDTACAITVVDRGLNNQGDVVYEVEDNGNHYYLRRADGTRTELLRRGSQFIGQSTVSYLGRAFFASTGAVIAEVYPVGGQYTVARWTGTAFEKLITINDTINLQRVNWFDVPTESGGQVYSRIGLSDGSSRLMRYADGAWTTLVKNGQSMGNTQINWIHRAAAGPAGPYFLADSDKGTSVFRWRSDGVDLVAPASSWADVSQMAVGTTAGFVTGTLTTGTAGLYKVTPGGPAAGIAIAAPVDAASAVLWDSIPERVSVSAVTLRGPGEGLVRLSGGTVQTLVGTGSKLTNGAVVLGLGAVATSAAGAAVSVNTSAGPALLLAHDGKTDLVADVSGNFTVGGQKVTWLDWGSSPYAVNAKGQIVASISTQSQQLLVLVDTVARSIQRIAAYGSGAAGGSTYGWVGRAAVDETGRVVFLSNLGDGSTGLFLWDGSAVRRLLRSGDAGLGGAAITGFNSVQFAGARVITRVNYPATNIIQALDGETWRPLVSPGDALSFGRTIDYFTGPDTMANGRGDMLYAARLGGVPSVILRTAEGRDVLVASGSEPLPGGAWPIAFYGFNLTAKGEVLLTAEAYKDGVSRMILYSGIPE